MASGADILVIDDDPVIRETVGDVLREHGHHVDRVERGRDALARIGQPRPVDLAIVDCRLPDISGLELLRSIKTRSPETEVILITGHASLDGALAAMAGDATSYLVKPVDTAQLLSTVDRALARKGLLRALRDSEERYRLITQSMTEALFLLDLDGGLALVNAYGEQITGFRSDELIGRPIFSVLDRAGAVLVRERLEAVRAGRKVVPRFECQVVRRDGRRIPIEMTCTSIVRDGVVVGRLAVARDITERKQSQAVQALLSSIVESSEDAIVGRTLEGRIVSWNPAAERLYGYTAQEAIGRSVSLIVPPERRDELPGILVRLHHGHRISNVETVCLTKAGRRVDVSLTISPIKDASGRVTGASSTARDITGRLRAERTARALAQVGHELLGTLDLDQIATRIVRAVLDVFRARRAVLYELEPASRTMVCVAAAGPADAAKWVGCHLPAGAGIAWLAVNARRLVASEGALTDGPALDRDAEPFTEEAGQSVIAVPLMGQDRVLGALMVGGDPDRVYSGEEQHLLAVFGDQAALALRNAQLFTETERGRHIAERLAAVARSVPQSLTFTELGRQIADGMVGLLEAHAAAVYRLDPETWTLVRVAVSASGESGPHADPILPRGAGLEGVAATTQQPVPTADLLEDPRVVLSPEARQEVSASGHGAALALPLLVQGRVVGAVMARDRTGRSWTGEDIALARAFADQAAVALENSHLYQGLQTALDEVRAAQHELIETERLRAIASLTDGVTDYVRQVLQMIMGKVQVVLPQLEGTPGHDQLATIKTTVKEAAKVLKRLQSFAEVRTLTAGPPLDFNEVVQAAIEATRPCCTIGDGADARHVRVAFDHGALPVVAGEASVLIEAVTVVLMNAIEALPEGGTITVETREAGSHVLCTVHDDGVGLTPDAQRRAL
ncbi:MAG TPA: PAS domain S-box protein, partial [Methylomirabilota bacterium]|nr:PAS domain S-box protein [Methylomirabilota bacterium]